MTAFDRTWDAAYDATPDDDEDITLGASRVRNLKVDIQQRVGVDHSFDGDFEDGKHNKVTLRPQAISPSKDVGDGALYAQSISGNTELLYADSSGHVVQFTSGGNFALTGGTISPNDVRTTSLEVFGTATINSLTVTDITTPSINATSATLSNITVVTENVTTSTISALTTVSRATFTDPQFYAWFDGNNPVLNFDNNTYIQYNRTLHRFEFVVAGVTVGHFP